MFSKETLRQLRYIKAQNISRHKSVFLFLLLRKLEHYYTHVYDNIIDIINDKLIGSGRGIKILIFTPQVKNFCNNEKIKWNSKENNWDKPTYERCVFVKRTRTIKSNSFHNSNIDLIRFDDCIKNIGPYAFGSCIFLKKVIFEPQTILNNCSYCAFDACCQLEYFVFPKISTIPNNMLNGSRLSKIIIPDGTRRIGRFAFLDIKNLKEVVIPKSVKIIDVGAFLGTAIEKVKIAIDCEYSTERYEIHPTFSTMINGAFNKNVIIEYYDQENENEN